MMQTLASCASGKEFMENVSNVWKVTGWNFTLSHSKWTNQISVKLGFHDTFAQNMSYKIAAFLLSNVRSTRVVDVQNSGKFISTASSIKLCPKPVRSRLVVSWRSRRIRFYCSVLKEDGRDPSSTWEPIFFILPSRCAQFPSLPMSQGMARN